MKFLHGEYDSTTGKSTVALADRYGQYIGYAKLHPDDKENESNYMGCNIAEKRALIKMLKSRRKRIKIKLNATENIINEIHNKVSPNDIHRDIKKVLYFKTKDYNKQIERINTLIEEIEKKIEERISFRRKFLKKDKNN